MAIHLRVGGKPVNAFDNPGGRVGSQCLAGALMTLRQCQIGCHRHHPGLGKCFLSNLPHTPNYAGDGALPVVQVNRFGLGQRVEVDWHGVGDTVGRAPKNVTCDVSPADDLMATSVAGRVQKRRDAMRKAGLRPVQIWVPDTRRPDFAAECRRQSRLAAKADSADRALLKFMDAALADVDGWAA